MSGVVTIHTSAPVITVLIQGGMGSAPLPAGRQGQVLGYDAQGALAAVDPPSGSGGYDDTELTGRVAAREAALEDGVQGPPGELGPVGPQGPEGPQGPMGPAGADGAQGSAGPQGVAGADGIQGPAGAMGPAGAQGLKGDIGPQGAAGADGTSVTLRISTAANAASDSAVHPNDLIVVPQ